MAALLRKYCHRYFIINKRYGSNDSSKQVEKLTQILNRLKKVDPKASEQSSHDTKTNLFSASKIIQQSQKQQPKPKPIPLTQQPLPIPTQLDLAHHPLIQQQEPQQPPPPQPPQPPQQQSGQTDNISDDMQQRIESELFEPGKIRPFPANLDKTQQTQKKTHLQESQRLTKKSDNKKKYKEFAKQVTDSTHTTDITTIDVNINDNISQWIYDKILEYNGQQLPTPQDIVMQFPSISIQTAKDIRENVINQLIENTPSVPPPSENIFSTFNPRETDSKRDPFDFSLHSKHEFDGIQEFDPDFHANGINLNGLNPASWYGYNNIAYDDYFNCHEPNVQEVESEYGKFRCLLTTNNSNKLDINMILDLRRKIYKIDNDLKTVTFGLTAKNRKEFVGNNMDLNMIPLIPDNACLYFANLFYLIDDIIHLNKPFVIATSGLLYNAQSSLFLAASTRLADSSVRIIFNNCLYGQVPFGGAHYFNCINQKKQNKHQLFWNLLSNEAMSCYNAHEVGMVDWVMPSPNNVLFFNHFGNEIDKTFNVNFNDQDRFRPRAKIKSIIELFDRGTEYYTNKNNDTLLLDAIFSGSGPDGGGIDKIITRIEQISTADFDFELFVGDDIANNEKVIKNMISKTKAAMNNIHRSSPLALYLSYIIYYGSMERYDTALIENRSKENSGTEFFRSLLSYEYNAMCWLMYFGDFWEGIKYRNDNNYVPKWKWPTMDKFLSSKDINSLFAHTQSNKYQDVLQNSIIFNELPYSWMKPLNFSDVNLGIDDSVTSKVDIINKKNSNSYYLSDYNMLRGSVAPNIQFKLSAHMH